MINLKIELNYLYSWILVNGTSSPCEKWHWSSENLQDPSKKYGQGIISLCVGLMKRTLT